MSLNIAWRTGIDPSGYSSCARSYIKSLYRNEKSNVIVIADNIARNINARGIDSEELKFLSSITSAYAPDDFLEVNHCVPDRMIFNPRKNIMYTVVEMGVPKRWVDICNRCDLIMTASSFCKEKMSEYKIKEEKIAVIPHCHDLEIWNPDVDPVEMKELLDFNFLFMGDFTPRKNGDMAIECFVKAFEGRKDVSLTIKGYYNSFSKEDQKKLIKRIKDVALSTGVSDERRPLILFYGEPIDECEMPSFMSSFDCVVSPHRGEGWGLGLSQGMALGKPVISTGYSGNLEFMDDECSYLINIDGFESVCKEMVKINPNFEGHSWPVVNQDHFIDLMRFVEKNREESQRKGKLGSKKIHDCFSFKRVSDLIVDNLERV